MNTENPISLNAANKGHWMTLKKVMC